MDEFIQILVTINNRENAENIAESLVRERLAACVQILGPIVSTYWWEGKIEKGQEWLIIIKSRKELYGQVESFIKNNHPYEIPEIITIPIVRGNIDYLNWLKKETLKIEDKDF